LSEFEREQFVGARLAGATVRKIATLLDISRATVPKVMSAYTYHGKTTSTKRNNGENINIDRKRSLYIQKDCFEKSQNYCSTTEYTF
jgi:transposase